MDRTLRSIVNSLAWTNTWRNPPRKGTGGPGSLTAGLGRARSPLRIISHAQASQLRWRAFKSGGVHLAHPHVRREVHRGGRTARTAPHLQVQRCARPLARPVRCQASRRGFCKSWHAGLRRRLAPGGWLLLNSPAELQGGRWAREKRRVNFRRRSSPPFILPWTTEAIRARSSANQLRAGWSLIGRFILP
jgi:hypothetical protein